MGHAKNHVDGSQKEHRRSQILSIGRVMTAIFIKDIVKQS
jgi:hypothetical protein